LVDVNRVCHGIHKFDLLPGVWLPPEESKKGFSDTMYRDLWQPF